MKSYAPYSQIDAPRTVHANRTPAGAMVFAMLPVAAIVAASAPVAAMTVALGLVSAGALYRSTVAKQLSGT